MRRLDRRGSGFDSLVSDMIELDKESTYRDRLGRKWEWSDLNGWVINRMATFGGFWPDDEFAPFTVIDPCPTCGR
ncbi:hypothetical protein SEA_MOOSTARD_102 [Mycobacterium phage Moostard]|nr:hypothetical protein SEA_FINNRY_106 [Mycobacterium phage Finnry]QZD99289.1 hypothetical protein SEA_MOOSTARD_102 [Mycobacterium phage Moostard]